MKVNEFIFKCRNNTHIDIWCNQNLIINSEFALSLKPGKNFNYKLTNEIANKDIDEIYIGNDNTISMIILD
jgi:hypothetical protein